MKSNKNEQKRIKIIVVKFVVSLSLLFIFCFICIVALVCLYVGLRVKMLYMLADLEDIPVLIFVHNGLPFKIHSHSGHIFFIFI